MNASVSYRNMAYVLRTVALCTLLAVGAAPTSAQLVGSITVDVPFSFVAGKKTLPAGTYVVQPIANKMLLWRDTRGEHASFVATSSADATARLGRSEVEFVRHGETYVLSAVRPAASTEHLRIAPPTKELRLARESAKPDTITLVANTPR
jgi:hypothetical protein